MPKRLRTTAIAMIVVSQALTVAVQPARADGPWEALQDRPTGTVAAAAAGWGFNIYVSGGVVGTAPTTTFVSKEPNADASQPWRTKAAMPRVRASHALAVGGDGRLYAIGGSTTNFEITNTVDAYDPVTDSWTAVAPMSVARRALAAATGHDGRIYAIGGDNNGSVALTTVERYDPWANTWTTLAPTQIARRAMAAVTGHDGKIHVFGGDDGRAFITETFSASEHYDPANGQWWTDPSMPTARTELVGAVGRDGLIYAMGGRPAGGSPLATVEAYSPTTNAWVTKPAMTRARAGHVGTLAGSSLMAVGGMGTEATAEHFPISFSNAVPTRTGVRATVAQARTRPGALVDLDVVVFPVAPASQTLTGTVEAKFRSSGVVVSRSLTRAGPTGVGPARATIPLTAVGSGDQTIDVTYVPGSSTMGGSSTTTSIFVDDKAPVVSLGAHEAATPAFSFSATDPTDTAAQITWVCTLDGASAPCTSPVTYPALEPGAHTFSVTATDRAGNATTRAFVDGNPPIVSFGATPAEQTTEADAAFTFSATDVEDTQAMLSFTCALDGASAPCTSPVAYEGLADGSHSLSVTATDFAGNHRASTYSWLVDSTPPVTTIDLVDTGIGSALLLPGDQIVGTSVDAGVGVDRVEITFDPLLPTLATTTVTATLECTDGSRRSCTWTVAPPAGIGIYGVTAVGTDALGNVETDITPSSIIVIAI